MMAYILLAVYNYLIYMHMAYSLSTKNCPKYHPTRILCMQIPGDLGEACYQNMTVELTDLPCQHIILVCCDESKEYEWHYEDCKGVQIDFTVYKTKDLICKDLKRENFTTSTINVPTDKADSDNQELSTIYIIVAIVIVSLVIVAAVISLVIFLRRKRNKTFTGKPENARTSRSGNTFDHLAEESSHGAVIDATTYSEAHVGSASGDYTYIDNVMVPDNARREYNHIHTPTKPFVDNSYSKLQESVESTFSALSRDVNNEYSHIATIENQESQRQGANENGAACDLYSHTSTSVERGNQQEGASGTNTYDVVYTKRAPANQLAVKKNGKQQDDSMYDHTFNKTNDNLPKK